MMSTTSSRYDRKRSRNNRNLWIAAVTFAVAYRSTETVSAFSSGIYPTQQLTSASLLESTRSASTSSTVETDALIAQRSPVKYTRYNYYDEDEEDEDDSDEYFFDDYHESVLGFQNLQKSTGSEVLQAELQKQIDEGAKQFLEHHVEGASELEKVAMSSITEQLPKAAVKALVSKQKQKSMSADESDNKHFKNRSNLHFGTERVSPEEEIQLARIIQVGAALYKIKADAENKLNKQLSRHEWAELAGMSPRDLRRRVSDYRNAKHDLVTANLGLVHAIVKQQWSKYEYTGITREELVQEGSLGLLRAAELFDPNRGLRFSTYAVVWIKGILQNSHLPELVRLPAREKTKWNKIVQATKDLKAVANDSEVMPTVEEIAQVTGMNVQEILETRRKMTQAKDMLSLDYEHRTQSRSGADTSTMDSVLHSDKNFQEDSDLAERTQLQAYIIAAMARNLDAREARLVRLRYGLADGRPRTLHECADAMGLSYTRVNQLSKRCLKKLREAAEAESLEEYLLTIA